jgi:hypothetical protein
MADYNHKKETARDAETPQAASKETTGGEPIISTLMVPQAMIFEPLLKAADIANCLNISKTSAYRLMLNDLPVVRFGLSTLRVRRSDLEDFIKKSLVNVR